MVCFIIPPELCCFIRQNISWVLKTVQLHSLSKADCASFSWLERQHTTHRHMGETEEPLGGGAHTRLQRVPGPTLPRRRGLRWGRRGQGPRGPPGSQQPVADLLRPPPQREELHDSGVGMTKSICGKSKVTAGGEKVREKKCGKKQKNSCGKKKEHFGNSKNTHTKLFARHPSSHRPWWGWGDFSPQDIPTELSLSTAVGEQHSPQKTWCKKHKTTKNNPQIVCKFPVFYRSTATLLHSTVTPGCMLSAGED